MNIQGKPGRIVEETYANTSLENQKLIDVEIEAVHMILNGISNDIYFIMDACPNEFGKFTLSDGESIELYNTRFYKMRYEMVRNKLKVDTMHVNVQFLQQLQPKWSRFVTIVKQAQDLDTVSYHKLFDILKQHQNKKSRMELHIENRENGRMILNSVQNGPLVWPTVVEEDGTTRTKRYEELSGDDPIACLNKAMAFLTAIASSRFPSTNNQLRTSFNPRNQATIQDGRVTVQQVQGRQGQSYAGTGYKGNATSIGGNKTRGQIRVVKCYNCQGEGHIARQCTQPKRPKNAAWFKEKAMLAEAQESGQILDEEQLAFLLIQAFQTVKLLKQPFQTLLLSRLRILIRYLRDYEITSDSNIILYSQSLQETQQAAVQDTNLYAQQDSMILSMIEQITREKIIDSQMDDMIKEKLALKQQINSLEQNLSNQIKEKESLLQTFTVFKNESKEKEIKYMDKEIDLEKKIKELENIVYKVGFNLLNQCTLLYLVNMRLIRIDDEETLILEELNRLSEDFGKRFVPQQELSNEQAFWLQTSHPNTDQIASSPVKIEAPKELPKLSLVNTSLKKLKYHLGQFDTVVKNKQIKLIAFNRNHINKAMRENDKEEKVKQEMDEIETINIELEHSVAKLLFENELLHKEIKHLKNIYKDQFDSIKKTRTLSKEHYDSLIAQLNSKSMENADLKGQIQEKVFVTLKGKNVLDNATTLTNATTIALGMFKLDLDPLAP
ncbi:retrovirus-related pol polyprotein from transposon TNT 1-94, partial [Tanacetum coccineum]